MSEKSCLELAEWLRNNNVDTRPLTGSDWVALEAFIHVMRLWATADKPRHVLEAAALCVREMQEKTRPVAKRAIPWALDWGHEHDLWPFIEAKLQALEQVA